MAVGNAENQTIITVDILKTLSEIADQVLKKQDSKKDDLSPKLAAIRDKINSGYYDTTDFHNKVVGKLSQNLLGMDDSEDFEE